MACPLILQHHDALYAEVPESEAEAWQARMVEAMQHPVPIAGRDVVFPVESKIGDTWADL